MKRQHNAEGTESKIILSMHVDDGLAASNDPIMYAAFLDALRKDFDLSDCGAIMAPWMQCGARQQGRDRAPHAGKILQRHFETLSNA